MACHASFEIVRIPAGKGWRVCISDGRRSQSVSGFAAKSQAEKGVGCLMRHEFPGGTLIREGLKRLHQPERLLPR